MNRIDETFKNLGAKKEAAFIPFVVLGDPSPDLCLQVVKAMEPNFDVLEVGIPFSDPLADGPTIQEANGRAFAAGINTDKAFELIAKIRQGTTKPIVILTYFNIVLNRRGNPQTGIEDFFRDMDKAGADGVIIADLPVEEAGTALESAKKFGKSIIFLVAPTTSAKRLEKVVHHAQGYLYVIAVLGVTGARASLSSVTLETVARMKGQHKVPLAVGFGISKPDHAREVIKAGADGVIVGSALVDLVKGHRDNPAQLLQEVTQFTKSMKDATRRA